MLGSNLDEKLGTWGQKEDFLQLFSENLTTCMHLKNECIDLS